MSPFATFGNAGESDPFTCGGRGGGGDCVMNCEDSALVNDGRLLYYVFNHQDKYIFIECYCIEKVSFQLLLYLWRRHVPILTEHVRGRELRDSTQRRVMIGRLVW